MHFACSLLVGGCSYFADAPVYRLFNCNWKWLLIPYVHTVHTHILVGHVTHSQCCQIVNKVHRFMNFLLFAELFYELPSICEHSVNFGHLL